MSAYVTHAETPGRQFAYITNYDSNSVSIIDTSTNTVTATVPVESGPVGVAVNLAGTRAYVANMFSDSVSVIDTTTNTVTATVPVESGPVGVAVNLAGTRAYVANMFGDSVSVIDTTTNTVTDTVPVGFTPVGVAVNPAGTNVYVASQNSKSIYVIDTSTNTVTDTVPVGNLPTGVTVNPKGTKVYVTDYNDNRVSVIDTSTNTVTASVTVGSRPQGVAVNPTGTKAYVANQDSNTVSVIDTSTNTVIASVPVGSNPYGVVVNLDGTKVYVANQGSNNVSVIDTTTNTVTATVSAGPGPIAFGQFMIPSLASEPVLPVANFSSNVTSGYAPLSVQFTDNSLNATGWNWDFGDGFNSTEQNPSHVYVSSGSYTVNLTVTNTAGTNTSSRAGYILVSSPAPTAAFNGTPTSGTVPMNVTFTDLSIGSPTGWAWFFGDEPYTQMWTQMNASSGWPARICYSSVALPDGSIVLMGGWDETNKLNDVWRSTNKGATWTKVSNAGWSARAHHSSVVLPDGSIVLMGGSDSTSSRNDTWQSTDKGITWTLVNASSGWTGRYYHSSVALPDGSIVLMGGSDDATWRNDTWLSEDKGATWKRMNESAGWTGRILHSSASLPDGSIILTGGLDGTARLNDTWLSEDKGATWTLMNGSSGWMGRTSHSNVAMPDGSVLLMGGLGIDNTPLKDIWRSTDKGRTWTKVADAGWSGRYYHNVVALSDGSIVLMGGLDDTTLLNDTWRLQPAGSNDPNPTHTYTAPGTYKVTLQAFNAGGYNSTCKTGYVTVTQSSPTAAFNGTPTSGTEPLTVTFADSSTGEPTTWLWDFGDGTNSTEQHPSHTYTSAGNYTIILKVSNLAGNDTLSRAGYVMVLPAPVLPVVNFSANVTSGYAPLSVQFTDSSLNATAWNWDFGDGFNSTEQNPKHTYSTAGNYTVNLTASNLNGTDSKLATITVSEEPVLPVANFSSNVTSGYVPLSVQFTDLSENTTGLNWDFGDGFNSTEQNPAHTYSIAGNYTVNLTVSNLNGTDSKLATITVSEKPVLPVANFSSNVSSGYAPLSVQFNDSSLNATGWNWDFGDGFNSTEQNPKHIYSTTGNYTINLAASNGNGTNSTFATITVLEYNPDYSIDKIVTDIAGKGPSANVTRAGEVISYQINVTNDGNIDLSNITVNDPLVANLIGPSGDDSQTGILNLGEKWTFTGTYTVTQADLNSNGDGDGFINNTATVDCAELDQVTDSASVTIEQIPDYSIDKIVTDVAGKGPLANVTGAGEVISYQINVTNDGNVDLTNINVTDPLVANLTGPSGDDSQTGILNVGEKWTFTGTYTVTQDDLNNNGDGDGFINNTATVDCAELDQVTDSAEVPVEQIPDYSIDKIVTDVAGKGPLANVTGAGEVISYQINVTNDGNVDLTNINVTDPLVANLTGPSGDDSQTGILNVGEKWIFTGTYTVTQDDLNNNGDGDGFINNTATVDCAELDQVTDSASVTIEQIPAYSIDKIVTDIAGKGPSANVTRAGEVISYQINVTNDGNIDLSNITVNDPLVANLIGPSGDDSQTGILNVGEKWTFTGTYTVTQADLNNNGDGDGFINNTATVDCAELDQVTDSASVTIEQIPDYSIDKIVTDVAGKGPSGNVTGAGEVISYQINVTNDGNVDLTNINVTDPLVANLTGPSGDDSQTGILNVGEKWTFTGTYTVTQADLNNNGDGDGFINNTATVDCDQLDPENDSEAVPITRSPDYTIDKTVTDLCGSGPSANVNSAGDVISYQIRVNNNGNVDLTNVSVTDPLLKSLTGPLESVNANGVLELGENWTYTGAYTVTQADLNSNGGGDGFINNTATVDCDQLGPENDSAAVQIIRSPGYTIDKTVTDVCGKGPSANVTSAGDVISYQIKVDNNGNVDLTNVSVNDPLLGDLTGPLECLNADGILEVRESWIYCGTYTVTQEDLNNNGGGDGFFNNTATVDCAELNPKSDSAAVSIEQKPACRIDKIVIDVAGNGPEGHICSAGDVVSFQVNVTNNGNIDLNNISVRDSLLNLRGPYGDTGLVGLYQSSLTRYTNGGDGILSVGETWYYLGNYTVTQEDLNNNGGGDGFLNSTVTFDSSETEPINETTIHYVDESENESENESSGIRIEQNPDYSIYKSVIEVENGKDGVADNAGDVIRYRILVKNEGNVDLTGVSVNDLMITLEGPLESKAADRVLEVGENWTYTGNYTVTQEDINSNGGGDGYIDNTATVSCNELSNKNSSVKVLLPAAEISGGRSGHGSGTGSARIVSDTSENVDVNGTSTEENETKIQFEEETEYVEKETGNETAKPQTTNEEIKSKIAPIMKMIYGIAFLLIACLLIVFMYKRRRDEQE